MAHLPLSHLIENDHGAASCSSRGVRAGESANAEARSILSFAHDGEELSLKVQHAARTTTSTGGHIWSCSRDLARWLYARRTHISGARILELGCGLAVPSLVAAACGSFVVATDETEVLLEHVVMNAARNGCRQRVETCRLDFTKRSDILRIATEPSSAFDMVIFADCIYGGGMGSRLPHALAELLVGSDPPPLIVGAFASDISMRPGIQSFWEQVDAAGLHCVELRLDETGSQDLRSGRLFAFKATSATRPSDGWGEEEEEDVVLGPLFDDVEETGPADLDHAAAPRDVALENTPPVPARRETRAAASTKLDTDEDTSEDVKREIYGVAPARVGDALKPV